MVPAESMMGLEETGRGLLVGTSSVINEGEDWRRKEKETGQEEEKRGQEEVKIKEKGLKTEENKKGLEQKAGD